MLATLQTKLIGGGIALLILIALFTWGKGVLNERAALRDWQVTVLDATKKASANPKLVARDVAGQIDILGGVLLKFKEKIAVQNEAVALGDKKVKEADAARDREAALRKEVIERSQSLAQQLQNEALSPVEKEKLEAELRRVQDVGWEAGL